MDEGSVVVEVGEYFEKEFNRELENCTTKMRHGSEGRDGNLNTYLRWFEHVGSFGLLRVLGALLPLTSILVAS